MKWLYSFVAVVFLSVLSSVIFSQSSSAVSPYDNLIYPNETPIIYNNQNQSEELNVDFFYSDTIINNCSQEIKDLWAFTRNGGGRYNLSKVTNTSGSRLPSAVTLTFTVDEIDVNTQFFTSSGPSYYFAHQNKTQNNTYSVIVIYDGSVTVNCQQGYISTGYGSTQVFAIQQMDINQSSCAPQYRIAPNGCLWVTVVSNTYNINYPSGYQGAPISVIPPENPNKEKIRPNVIFDVMNKSISINSKPNQEVLQQYPDYKVFWFITNANIDGEGSSCETPFTTSGYSIPNEPLNFDVPCLGVYSVNAYFAYSNGTYPIEDFGVYKIVETTLNIDVNGSFFSIDTDNGYQCDENNFCQHESALWVDEQCDLLHLGGCVNNIIHYLKVALGIEKTATNPTGSPFVSFRTDTYGLLSIVTAPLNAINALTTSTCTPISFTIPYINKPIVLPCYYTIYQQNLGAIFTVYQTIATGVIAYFVIVGILRQVKEIKDPKKDSIEVVKL